MKISVKQSDLKIEHILSSGPGGQHRDRKQTGIRITHKPTGIVVTSTNQRSQAQNKRKAFEVLEKRLASHYAVEAQRNTGIVGFGSDEVVRTYDLTRHETRDHTTGTRHTMALMSAICRFANGN